ncbi:helicase-related protein, partial [Sulfoacidibacillus ferrooxidans]|uniref:helicase-related protein n=1 Tax=Sulfoacidibacillus ferrooxidans TaxID=2005001 RepID=UPI001F50EB04
MKEITCSSPYENITAKCHLMVSEQIPGQQKPRIIAAGIIDVDSAAKAISAKIATGRPVRYGDAQMATWQKKPMTCDTGGAYRFFRTNNGKKGAESSTHAMIVHKRVMEQREELERQKIKGNRILLAPDGDLVSRLGDVLLDEFAFPHLPEWFQAIYAELQKERLLTTLDVWTDPDVDVWRDLQAITLSDQLTDRRMQEIVSRLIQQGILNIPEGVTDAPAITEDITDTTSYLAEYAPHLATQIEEVVEPLHDLDRPLEKALATMQRVPFPAQAHTIQALINGMDHGKKAVFSISDMGTGKTIQALGVANVLWQRAKTSGKQGFVSFVLAPGVTIPKWVRDEIKATLPDAKIRVLENWHDTVAWIDEVRRNKFKKTNGLEFVLMGKDAAKLGVKRLPTLHWRRVRGTTQYDWHCPHCGELAIALENEEGNNEDLDAQQITWSRWALGDASTQAMTKGIPFREAKRIIHCAHCEATLTRFADPQAGETGKMKHRRMEPAWLIQRYLKGYMDLLIVDELQQYKNESGQGVAMGSLVTASKRVLGLTGTLSDGKASSLFAILARTDFSRLQAEGFDHNSSSRFVQRYGVLEEVIRYEDEISNAGGNTRGKVKSKQTKELPGLSPQLFVNHLADKTAFLELGDLGLPLVKIEEKPVFVQMDEEHLESYRHFHSMLDEKCKQLYMLGNTGAYASFIPSVINVANQPQLEIEAHEVSNFFVSDGSPSAKERQLIADVKAELAQHRRVMVYVTYSGEYAQDRRLVDVLETEDIPVRVMRSSVSADDRIEWIEQAVKDGVQVIVTNVSLVEVGVDLLDFPTLIFYQQTDKIATMRQASRRSWRIGQTQNCKVLHYVYENSYEVTQFQRNMAKRAHALLLEGRLDRSEMRTYMPADRLSVQTTALAAHLENVADLSDKWS